MNQLGQKVKTNGYAVPLAVSLDSEKPALAGYAQRLGKDWTVLCDYKGYDSKAAKDYAVKHAPTTVVLDAQGRIRLGDSLSWLAQDYVEDLWMEAFWAKRRGLPAVGPVEPPTTPPPPAPKAAAEVQWVFELKSGGKIKVISYEEKDGKYVLKLPTGSSTVSKEDVERITKVEPQGK